MKNLVIVESPAKAKTIESYLGKDFIVKSSYGHVRDLKKGDGAIDVDDSFKPTYEVSADKKQIVSELKKLAKEAEVVWLATDEDREGEAISWHLMEALKLKEEKIKRIVFSEITKPAILKAIENPRTVDINLVNAQQARRVLDRLVGFKLSPILWRKVKPSLSAGRVQSVAVRIIVEREREILAFESTSSYRVVAEFKGDGRKFKAQLGKRFATQEEAEEFLKKCQSAEFSIDKLEKKPAKKSAAAPFTTSTLQQEASRKLGYPVGMTMMVAQRLYEAGKITYMRTDSVNLSDTALNAAEAEIKKSYGPEYSKRKSYNTKSKGAQEAHEAIRPTDMSLHNFGDDQQARLYDLIWKRTIASQMTDAQFERTNVGISLSNTSERFSAKGEIITFEGFLKVYLEGTDESGEEDELTKDALPPLSMGQLLNYDEITATQRFTQHPARYTEASLVKKLEELGIGRPSTYAPTISTIQKRGYVHKDEREGTKREYGKFTLNGELKFENHTEITGREKGKMQPSDIGMVVNDFLVEHFGNVLDFGFTASVEKEFDEIAQGMKQWNKMIKEFYGPFEKDVVDTLENSERASGERILGNHPESGKTVLVRIGRYGPMAQIGAADDEEKKFASLLKDQSIGTISLEEALDLFKLPRQLGQFEDKVVTAAIGRFGPYIRHDGKFVSIKEANGDDPFTITLERGVELIQEKRESDAKKLIKTFEEDETVTIQEGRWGPYIKFGKQNVKIPKDKEPKELTWEEVKALAEEAAKNPPKRKGRAKAKAKPKASKKK